MYHLYKKNEMNFSLAWIVAYVVLASVADNFSASLGIHKSITVPVCIALVLLIFVFIKKHDLSEKYGLCSFKGNLKDYLYFIPLVLIVAARFRNGVTMNVSGLETVLHILSMLSVGFIEEVIFRGFLFKAMCKDNVKTAIFVSSLTFGLGHIVNLFNGKDLIPTLIQICFAIAIGYLFTIIFYKGKSLWPCIIAHSLNNAVGIFTIDDPTQTYAILSATIMCVICIGYALCILKNEKEFNECKN